MMLLLASLAHAETLDFEAALRAALTHGADARIVSAEADWARADSRAYAAWQGNPEVEIERRPGETTATVSVPLEIAGQPFARGAAASRQREAADLRARAGRAAVAAAAGAAYLDTVRAREQAELAEAAEGLAVRLRDAAMRRETAGELSPAESALHRAEAARALDSALTLRLGAEVAARRLGVIVGADDTPAVGEWPTVPEPPTVEVGELPALLAASLEARAALARLTAERLERVPDVRLVGGWSFEGEVGPVLGASLEIPLFAPGFARTRATRAEAEVADAQALRERLDLRAALADARSELMIAERIAAAWDIPGLQGALDAAGRRHEAGESSIAVYVTERDLALAAREGAIDARWRLERARLALWELAGQLPMMEER